MDENQNKTKYPLDFIKVKNESGSEDVHYSAFYEGIPPEYELMAQRMLNETKENKEKGLKKLRAFMEKEELTASEDILIAVLRCTKYKTKKAEAKLKRFLKFRQKTIQLLANMDEKKAELILEDVIFGILPYRDKHGRTVIFSRPNLRLDLYDMDDIQPLAFAMFLYLYTFPLATVCGASYIGECKTDNLYIFYAIMKSFKPYIFGILDMPVRYGRGDFLNINVLVRLFYKAMKPLLSEKITNRANFHGNGYDNLLKLYHPDILPSDFGGNLEPINSRYFRERLVNYIKQLKVENNIQGN